MNTNNFTIPSYLFLKMSCKQDKICYNISNNKGTVKKKIKIGGIESEKSNLGSRRSTELFD